MKAKYNNRMICIKTSLANELCILECAEKNFDMMFSRDEYKNISITTIKDLSEKIRTNIIDALTLILSEHPTLFTVYKCESIRKELNKKAAIYDSKDFADCLDDSERFLELLYSGKKLITATISVIPDKLCPKEIGAKNANTSKANPLIFIKDILNIKGNNQTC